MVTRLATIALRTAWKPGAVSYHQGVEWRAEGRRDTGARNGIVE
jgi:hypothetical protein